MLATAEQILARKPAFKDIACPELGEGVEVRIKRLDAEAFITLMKSINGDKDNAFAYWIGATCINAEGQKLFTVEQVKQLGSVDFALVNRLATEAMAINGAAPGEGSVEKK